MLNEILFQCFPWCGRRDKWISFTYQISSLLSWRIHWARKLFLQWLCRTVSEWRLRPRLLLLQWSEIFSLACKAEKFSPLDSLSGSWKENGIQLNTTLQWTFLTLLLSPTDVFIHSPRCQEDRNYLQPGFPLKHKAWSLENQASAGASGKGGDRITELTLETPSLNELAQQWQSPQSLSFPKAELTEASDGDNWPWQYLLTEMSRIGFFSPNCIEHVLQMILASLTVELSNQISPTEIGTQWFFTHTTRKCRSQLSHMQPSLLFFNTL